MGIAQRMRELIEINRALAAAADRDEVLALVATRTAELSGADLCLLLLGDSVGRARVAASHGLGDSELRALELPFDEGLVGALRANLGLGERERFMGVPVVGPAGMRGVLAVFWREGGGGFEEELLEALADQAAIALENAERLYRLQEALCEARREREELAAVMEAAPVAIFLMAADEQGIGCANGRAKRMLSDIGISDFRELEGRMFTPDGEPIAYGGNPIAGMLAQGRELRGLEVVIESPDGRSARLEVNAAPLRPAASGRARAVVAVEDVSVREQLRLEREHAEALAEANRTKDVFFNTLSHELRTPLAAIRNAAELVRRNADPARRERACAIINRSVAQQTRLMDDLLDLSRIMLGRLRLAREPLDLDELVAGLVEGLEQEARRKGLELRLERSQEPLTVLADRDRLSQVVVNLLTNAIRYTDRGSIVVRVARESGEAAVAVRDTGVGLSAQALAHLFEPFRVSDPALERSSGGLGIGLSIAGSLARQHDGRIEAQSDGPGRGSLFTLRLPLCHEAPRESAQEAPCRAGQVHRVLVVEDDLDVRESLAELLREWGHQVETACDGAGAIERMARGGIDVALVDLGLPDINGHAIAQRVSACAGTAPRLVALTGFVGEAQQEAARLAGFSDFIAKPLEPQQLALCLERLCTQR